MEMTKILKATQDETKMSRQVAMQSQKLSENMMKDSVAMKTVIRPTQRSYPYHLDTCQIAILTAFFLPGTSFAVGRENIYF